MSEQLVIEIKEDDAICILRISGRLAAGVNDAYLQAKAREIQNTGCNHLLVDLRELRSVGSAGIGFFADLYNSVTRKGAGRLVLMGPVPHVEEVLAETRLSTIVPIAADMPAAMAFLASGSKTIAVGSSRE